MTMKNMAYWKAKNNISPLKQDDDDTDADADAKSEDTSKSKGGGMSGVGKDLLTSAGTAIINKALEGKPKEKIINPTSSGFSSMRFGS